MRASAWRQGFGGDDRQHTAGIGRAGQAGARAATPGPGCPGAGGSRRSPRSRPHGAVGGARQRRRAVAVTAGIHGRRRDRIRRGRSVLLCRVYVPAGRLLSWPAISQLPGRAAYPSRVAGDHYIQAALMGRWGEPPARSARERAIAVRMKQPAKTFQTTPENVGKENSL
jgi:hypothetical protein